MIRYGCTLANAIFCIVTVTDLCIYTIMTFKLNFYRPNSDSGLFYLFIYFMYLRISLANSLLQKYLSFNFTNIYMYNISTSYNYPHRRWCCRYNKCWERCGVWLIATIRFSHDIPSYDDYVKTSWWS